MNKKPNASIINAKVSEYFSNCYFDVQSTPSKSMPILDEAHLAKLVTRIVVSAATLFTTTISLKQYAKEVSSHYRKKKL